MTVLITNTRERNRFLRFAVVGVIGAVVDFGVMNLVVALFHTSLIVAGTISFIAAIFSNFTWNRYWTYPDSRSKPVMRQLVEFSVVSVLGLAIRVPALALIEPLIQKLILGLHFSIPVLTPKQVVNNVTLAITIVIVMFWNFFVNRYWTYSDVS